MARAAAARRLPFLHISTDYVFGGPGSIPWREGDAVDPRCVYARTKADGEAAVAEAGGPHVILRTAWVFAGHGRNFVETILRAGMKNRTLRVVEDQIGCPTAAADIAAALLNISRAFAEGRGTSGIFHFCGAPAVSWCDFARGIFARTGWASPPEVQGIGSQEWPTAATRPPYSALDCTKILDVYGIPRPDWRVSLDPVLGELKESVA
jgi:dTDP-4-dehydrorhamnose reductase